MKYIEQRLMIIDAVDVVARAVIVRTMTTTLVRVDE